MIRIYGASDDLVEIEGITGGNAGDDHLELDANNAVIILGDKVTGGVLIGVRYSDPTLAPDREEGAGCWAVQVSPLENGVPIPWPVTIRHRVKPGHVGTERRAGTPDRVLYTAVAEIDAPADTPKTVLYAFGSRTLVDYYKRSNDAQDEGEE